MLGWVNPQVLPSPLAVAEKWVAYLLPAAAVTPAAELAGVGVLGRAGGRLARQPVPGGGRASRSAPGWRCRSAWRWARSRASTRWFNPLLQLLRPIPPIAYIPLSILWFGLGNPPAVFLIALGAFFPVLMNTIAGVRHVDGIYLRAARNLGAGGSTMFLRVILPAAVPYILSGVRIGHRHRLHRRDRLGDDRGEQRAGLPHP